MSNNKSDSFGVGIGALVNLAGKLKNDLLIYGAVGIVGLIILLGVAGYFFKGENETMVLPILALGVYLVTNLYIIYNFIYLKQTAELRRFAAEFETEAQRAFDSFALSAMGIITKIDAGILASGWENNLKDREIKGFWEKMPGIFRKSLKAENQMEGKKGTV